MTWEFVVGMLPWLLLILVCPVAMFWMMRGKSHGESSGTSGGNAAPNAQAPLAAAATAGSREDEIRELKERLARLEARKTSSRAKLP